MTISKAASYALLFLARIDEALDSGCPQRIQDVEVIADRFACLTDLRECIIKLRAALVSESAACRAFAATEILVASPADRFERLFRLGPAGALWDAWGCEEANRSHIQEGK